MGPQQSMRTPRRGRRTSHGVCVMHNMVQFGAINGMQRRWLPGVPCGLVGQGQQAPCQCPAEVNTRLRTQEAMVEHRTHTVHHIGGGEHRMYRLPTAVQILNQRRLQSVVYDGGRLYKGGSRGTHRQPAAEGKKKFGDGLLANTRAGEYFGSCIEAVAIPRRRSMMRRARSAGGGGMISSSRAIRAAGWRQAVALP